MKTIVTFSIALFLSIVNGIGASYPLGSPTPSLADIYGNPIRIGYGLGVTNRWLYTTNSGGGGASLQYYTVATESERYALPDLHNGDVVFQAAAGPTADWNRNWLLVDSDYSTNAAGWVALPTKYFQIYGGGTATPTTFTIQNADDTEYSGTSVLVLPSTLDLYSLEAYDTDALDGVFTLDPFKSTLDYIDVSNNNLTEFDTPGFTALATMYLHDNFLTGTFSAPDSSAMTDLDISNNLFTDFDGTGLTSLTTLDVSNNPLTSFNGQGLVSLTTLNLNGLESSLTNFVSGNMGLSGFNIDLTGFTNLTTLNISGSTNITNILAVTTALTSASVNNTLTNLAWFGLSNGVVDLSGGTSATTNAAGSAAVDTLVSRGWSVNNN